MKQNVFFEATPAIADGRGEEALWKSCLRYCEKSSRRRDENLSLKHPKDEDFIRGKVPMTKETIRRLSIEKFYIGNHSVCYDIGAGTGSVSVEMGLAIRRSCNEGSVYAIEREPEALELIRANVQKVSWKLGRYPTL